MAVQPVPESLSSEPQLRSEGTVDTTVRGDQGRDVSALFATHSQSAAIFERHGCPLTRREVNE
jgi:hypothetical protein